LPHETAGTLGAQASCTGTSFYTDVNGFTVSIPTIGNGTHLDNCLLGVGYDSEAVAWLQGSLNACYGQHLTVDGSYGRLTEAAVEVAQRDAKITPRRHLRAADPRSHPVGGGNR
jgi:hypothetical protein